MTRHDRNVARLVAAGLCPDAAAKVAGHPLGGPVVIGPGVIVSLFDPSDPVIGRCAPSGKKSGAGGGVAGSPAARGGSRG